MHTNVEMDFWEICKLKEFTSYVNMYMYGVFQEVLNKVKLNLFSNHTR